jgi:DNA topoisomerase-3
MTEFDESDMRDDDLFMRRWRSFRQGDPDMDDYLDFLGSEAEEPDEDVDEAHIITPPCPKCAATMVARKGSYGEFWGCSRYPECKGTRPVSPRCPKCGSPTIERNGPYGAFWGCLRFPECRGSLKIDDSTSGGGA